MTSLVTAVRELQRQNNSQNQSSSSSNSFYDFANENYFAFLGIIIGGLIVLVASVCFLKSFCKNRYDIDICPGAAQRRRDEQLRIARDRRLALELQHGIEEEHRELAISKRIEERTKKYRSLMKGHTMVVSEKNLIYQDRLAEDNEDDPELGDGVSDNFLLTLPVTDEKGKSRRVSGNCAICIGEYAPGETVVWSTNSKCHHAYHEECILTWLGKGKKRCPTCRNTFMPSKVQEDGDTKMLSNDDDVDYAISEQSQESIAVQIDDHHDT